MFTFHTRYRPITSRPFLAGPSYMEYKPSEALRPYVLCYWGTDASFRDGDNERIEEKILVIPDTCVDIIIEINTSKKKIGIMLCGLQDYPITAGQSSEGDTVTEFAVRFHFWAANLFLQTDMRGIYNQFVDLELVRPGSISEFEPLFYQQTMKEKIAWMEGYLLEKIDGGRINTSLYNSIDQILKYAGRPTVKEICEYSCVSQRQMERLFLQEVGLSMKRTASLVRYQNVWRDIVLQKEFQVQEAVYRYGYTDQSHLLKEFKRFHGMTPEQAKNKALGS